MGKKSTKKEEPVIPLEGPTALMRDQYEVLVAGQRRLENDLSSIDRDLEHDRRDMQDFKIRLSGLEQEVRELRNAINLNAERVKDKVADAVGPMVSEVQDLKEAVEKKKVLAFNKGKGFWAKLFKRG